MRVPPIPEKARAVPPARRAEVARRRARGIEEEMRLAASTIAPLACALALAVASPLEASARQGKRPSTGKAAPARKKAPPPVPPLTREGMPNVMAASAVVVDLDDGIELYAKDPDRVRAIASVGKIVLALVVLEKGLLLDEETIITAEDRDLSRGGARSRLPVGKGFTNRDLLRAALVASDNRACSALGRAVGLTPEQLVAAMNRKARELGMKKTRFQDPSGLRGNYSTAREVAVALRAALGNPVIAELLAERTTTVRSTSDPRHVVQYANTNVALRAGRHDVLGGKTGYTDEARYCLAIAARLEGRRLGMVFLGAEGKLTRFADFNRVAAWVLGGGIERALAARER
jgi:serine-type D-Ala-D-Ala endopeptidase (penicillin-binding protein 7)